MNADGCLLEGEKEEKFFVWIKKSNHFGRYFAEFFVDLDSVLQGTLWCFICQFICIMCMHYYCVRDIHWSVKVWTCVPSLSKRVIFFLSLEFQRYAHIVRF